MDGRFKTVETGSGEGVGVETTDSLFLEQENNANEQARKIFRSRIKSIVVVLAGL